MSGHRDGARAQESRDGDRVLHRYLEPGDYQRQRRGRGGRVASGEDGGGSAELGTRGSGLLPGPQEWVWTQAGPVGPQGVDAPHGPLSGGPVELDRDTDRVDELTYQSNFDPSVVPFKRGIAQNRVRRLGGGAYQTYLEGGRRSAVSVGGLARADEERFWGSFLFSVEPGEAFLVASVAPDQRILGLETEPQVPVEVYRDEADNFLIEADYRGLLRVEMVVAAPVSYFRGVLTNDVDWSAFGNEGSLLPREAQTVAGGVLEELGIDRRMSPTSALYALVEYHRDFEGRPSSSLEGRDRYVEITREKAGVCRHRSLTFMISARALGIETRYVYNEAHAFVEVNWPEVGWRRIDLGGAADQFNYQNQGEGGVHDAGVDGLPQPPAFQAELERLRGEEGRDEDGGTEPLMLSPAVARDEPEPVELEAEDFERADELVESVPERGEIEARSEREEGGPGSEMVEAEPSGASKDSGEDRVELLEASGEVFRGKELRVRGRVQGGGAQAGGQMVKVYLVSSGRTAREILLGEAETDGRGFFEAAWIVPRDVGVGRWRLRGELVE